MMQPCCIKGSFLTELEVWNSTIWITIQNIRKRLGFLCLPFMKKDQLKGIFKQQVEHKLAFINLRGVLCHVVVPHTPLHNYLSYYEKCAGIIVLFSYAKIIYYFQM